MKKLLKITGIALGVLIIFLLLAPFLFKGTLEDLLKKNLNENLNATVAWESLDLSLFSSFPDAAVKINSFSVINKAPFEGDTLARGEQLTLDMGIMQLFKSGDAPIKINALQLDNALVNIKIDDAGNANYDIAIKKETTENDAPENSKNEGFSFDLNHYEINNSSINYLDEMGGTFLRLSEFNHEGTGDFSATVSELNTKTNSLVSLQMGNVEYLKETPVSLDAIIQMDLENKKYTFQENKATINALPLTFNGFIKVNANSSELDLTFKTPSSDFKNFLAVIPKEYVKNLDGVTTTGDFTVDGVLKGKVDDTYMPKMDISVKSNNASFKYSDLPKAVRNISIDVRLINETGLAADTYLNIGGITFKIDDEMFTANGSIKNITQNAIVNMALKGTLNLANIEKVLPIELDQKLTGIIKADVRANFDMKSIENEQYQSIKTNGTASLSNFNYKGSDFKSELKIETLDMTLTPGNIKLNKFKGTTGETDIAATGTIQNLIPWLMAKQDLKGRFNLQSNTFNMNDFTSSETGFTGTEGAPVKASLEKEQIKIPDFLDATLDFTANKVIYDDVILTNTRGTISIKEETANLSNVTSDVFGGNIALTGNVSTKEETPTFAMDLDLSQIDIATSFQKSTLLKYFAPIANALDGDLNTTLKLSGKLNDNLTPNLATLAGDAVAQILTAEVNPQRAPILSKIGAQVSFLKLDQLSLQNLSTAFKFNNGKIEIQPFDFIVNGVKLTVAGSHGLDKSIKYNLTMDVPAKQLGSEVTRLLSKLDPEEANNMRVTVPVNITGTYSNPQVSLNMNAAITSITQKLIEKQKQELKDKGTNILKDIITGGGKPKDNSTSGKPKNTQTTTEKTEKVVKDILGDIFGSKKKKKDSIN